MATYTKETALYDTAAIAGDISDASTKATNYLSADSSGIMVYDGSSGAQTPSNPSANTSNVFIDSNSLNIRKGTAVLATFGSDVVIGKDDYGHVEITDEGMVVRGNDDGSPITSGDTSNSYMASRSLFIGDGADVATISMGASRTQVWSSYHSYDNDDSDNTTYIITNTNGAEKTANRAQTTISAMSEAQDREANVTLTIDDSTNESNAFISADHVYCNGTSLILSAKTVTFNLTTGSASARYAPDTSNNLGTAVVNLNTLSDLTNVEILMAVPIDATRNSGQDRAFLEVSSSQARIWGRPSQTYSCRIQVLYR
jgi:hypothetical protein